MDALVEKLQALSPDDSGDLLQVKVAVESALAMVEAYTRGRHVDAAGEYRPGVEAVVLGVAARLLANPGQVQSRVQAGSYSVLKGQSFQGFTLTEQQVLNRYRKRAM